jgi:hypothetical protein
VIAHIVLFRPRADLDDDGRATLLAALTRARREIPSIRRFRVGRRVRHSLPGYEQGMAEDYEFAAVIEFDDIDGLRAYLAHPAHEEPGGHFTTSAAAALAYDYEVVDL